MKKIIFIVLCGLTVFQIAMAIWGIMKNKPVRKTTMMGVIGGMYATFAYMLYTSV